MRPVNHTTEENVALDVQPETADRSRRLVQKVGILEREGVDSALKRVDLEGGVGKAGEAWEMSRDVLCERAVIRSAQRKEGSSSVGAQTEQQLDSRSSIDVDQSVEALACRSMANAVQKVTVLSKYSS